MGCVADVALGVVGAARVEHEERMQHHTPLDDRRPVRGLREILALVRVGAVVGAHLDERRAENIAKAIRGGLWGVGLPVGGPPGHHTALGGRTAWSPGNKQNAVSTK